MNQTIKHLFLGAVLLALFCITAPSVLADTAYYPEDTLLYGEVAFGEIKDNAELGEVLFRSAPETHDEIIRGWYAKNPTHEPGVYTYGDRLKITYTENGGLSVVTHSVSENPKKYKMAFPVPLLMLLNLHEVTDIHTVTRTDYNQEGEMLVKIPISGWFEKGSILPSVAQYEPIGHILSGENYTLMGQLSGALNETTLYHSFTFKTDEGLTSYTLYLSLDEGEISYHDETGEPLAPEQPAGEPTPYIETDIHTVQRLDRGFFSPEITVRMSAWFSYDGVHAPEATVVDLVGISHRGDFLCTDEYFIEKDEAEGVTTITGTVIAQKISDPNEVIKYTLQLYHGKDGWNFGQFSDKEKL